MNPPRRSPRRWHDEERWAAEYEQPFDIEALHELDTLAEAYESYSRPMAFIMDINSVAGVLSGLKPGAIINKSIVDGDLLSRLGVANVASVSNNSCIARDGRVAERLASLHGQLFAENYAGNRSTEGSLLYRCEQEVGVLLGYPETAVQYYLSSLAEEKAVGRRRPGITIHQEEMEDSITAQFHHLILSPDHYQEELDQYVRPLEEATRTLLPKTYEVICRITERERFTKPRRLLGEQALAAG